MSATSVSPTGRLSPIDLQLTARDQAQGQFPLSEVGVYTVSVQIGNQQKIASLSVSYPLEYRHLGQNSQILTQISHHTNGVLNPSIDQIRNQTFGKLELIIGYLSQNWKRGTAGAWRQNPALSGGGQAYDSGAHLLNSLCWSIENNVAEVFAFIDNHGTEVDINSSINVRFENGVFASIVVSGNCPSDSSHMTYIFDNGRIDIDGWGGSWIKVFDGSQQIENPPITDDMNAELDFAFYNSPSGCNTILG